MEQIPVTVGNIQRWAQFLKQIRHYFDKRGYSEVTTRHLVKQGAFEGTIDPLKVTWSKGEAQLHTSPEIQMKEVLSQARLPLYQICQCFRDDLEGPQHSREFTMLEFYLPEADYQGVIDETTHLIQALSPATVKVKNYSIEEIFQNILGFSLARCETKEKLATEISKRRLVSFEENDSWEDLFFRLMLEKIEPRLEHAVPTVLHSYPTAVSPLSRGIPGTFYAERFEIYWKEMELCNGCTELADGGVLKERAARENAARKAQGKAPHPFSESFLEATERMGRMAGVAVGLDRLFRALYF